MEETANEPDTAIKVPVEDVPSYKSLQEYIMKNKNASLKGSTLPGHLPILTIQNSSKHPSNFDRLRNKTRTRFFRN